MSAASEPPRTGVKRRLLDLIKRRGGVALDEAVRPMGLAKTTLRQHLLCMERQTLVRRRYVKGAAGRPRVVFELAEAGQRLFPDRNADLLEGLLRFLAGQGREDLVREFFVTEWKARRERFSAALGAAGKDAGAGTTGKSLRRSRTLARVLEEDGFMPRIERRNGGVEVRECNCPYSRAVRATRIPCELESEFIQWALGSAGPVTRREYMPNGSPACSYGAVASLAGSTKESKCRSK
jgi:predicted ArsR family transcriptional regulator